MTNCNWVFNQIKHSVVHVEGGLFAWILDLEYYDWNKAFIQLTLILVLMFYSVKTFLPAIFLELTIKKIFI